MPPQPSTSSAPKHAPSSKASASKGSRRSAAAKKASAKSAGSRKAVVKIGPAGVRLGDKRKLHAFKRRKGKLGQAAPVRPAAAKSITARPVTARPVAAAALPGAMASVAASLPSAILAAGAVAVDAARALTNALTPQVTRLAQSEAAAALGSAAGTLTKMILLPDRGLRARETPESAHVAGFFRALSMLRNLPVMTTASNALGLGATAAKVAMRVLDSVAENGAKLVEMRPQDAAVLRAIQPGLRLVPLRTYRLARVQRTVARGPTAAAAGASLRTAIRIVVAGSGTGIAGAKVVAFTNFATRAGADGTTDANGQVSLDLRGNNRIERLYVYPQRGYWSLLQQNVDLSTTQQFGLVQLSPAFTDVKAFHYGPGAETAGKNVRVGIVDTGVDATHSDLTVEGGRNTITGEDPNDWTDVEGHGTHVAGIIGGHGTPPTGIRGLAPSAILRAYRVFPGPDSAGDNFAISKAIDSAVQDNCDIINLSLKLEGAGEDVDEAVQAAIADARNAGVLVVAAAGNDDRAPVAFPARDPLVIAVTALGRKGTFPPGTTETADIAAPPGTDTTDFIGAFSNSGPQVDCTGPGVGVISSVPGGYAPMSGTSMASPAICGFTAALLSSQAAILNAPRNAARRDALATALLQSARSLGFPTDLEGRGLPK